MPNFLINELHTEICCLKYHDEGSFFKGLELLKEEEMKFNNKLEEIIDK